MDDCVYFWEISFMLHGNFDCSRDVYVRFFHAKSLTLVCSLKKFLHLCNIQNVHPGSTRVVFNTTVHFQNYELWIKSLWMNVMVFCNGKL